MKAAALALGYALCAIWCLLWLVAALEGVIYHVCYSDALHAVFKRWGWEW